MWINAPKPINEMTLDEIESEIEWNQSYFDDCEKNGQGISSKEAIRQRDLKQAVIRQNLHEKDYL